MNNTARVARPFLPEDRDTRFKRSQPSDHFFRALAACALARSQPGGDPRQIASQLYDEPTRAFVERAAVGPATTTTSGWASQLASTAVADVITTIAPRSAAAALMAAGLRVNLAGIGQVSVPSWSTRLPAPVFVQEGSPIPVVQGVLAGTALAPRKMSFMVALTAEALTQTNAEAVIRAAMSEALGSSLDSALFSDAAASAARPAGLFAGVTPITATAGGGDEALTADIKALVAAIVTAGGGANIGFIANPVQAVSLRLRSGGFPFQLFESPGITAGTIAAIELGGFASGLGDAPRIESSVEVALHYEDTAPTAIGTAGAPATVAAPVRSAFQSDLLVLRLILPVAWGQRSDGLVQVINDVTW
jgi:hypothetical protein